MKDQTAEEIIEQIRITAFFEDSGEIRCAADRAEALDTIRLRILSLTEVMDGIDNIQARAAMMVALLSSSQMYENLNNEHEELLEVGK
jgi:nucleotide-binding universal stress UspA family protein